MGKKKGGKGKGGGGGGGDGDGGGPSRPPTEQQQRAPPPQQSSGASEPFNVGGGAGGEGGGRGRGRGGEGGGRGWGRGGGEGRGRGGGGRGEGGGGEGGGRGSGRGGDAGGRGWGRGGVEGRGGGGGRGGEGGGRAWGRGDAGGDIGQPVSPPEYSLPGPGEAPRGGRGGVRGFGRGRGGPQAGEQRTPPDSAGLGGSGFTYGQPQTPPMQQHQQQQQQQPIQEVQQQVTQKPAPAASQLPATAEITQKMSKMDVAKWKLPERKKNGTRGRKIELELNHFELSFKNKDFIAIHYDVSFKPDKPRRMFRTIMEAFRRKKFPNNFPAFDGRKNLYSAKELPFGMSVTDSVKVFNDERYCDVEYEVTVKFASKVDMSQLSKYLNSRSQSYEVPQDALQAVDIVLRNPAALTFVGVGRSFFTKPEQIIDLGDGLELWFGFYQSAILGWKPFLNVDVAHKGFPMGERLLETLCRYQKCQMNDIRNIRNLDRFIQSEFEKYIKGLKVEYQIPQRPDTKRVYKVNKLVKNSIEQRFIFEKDNKKLEMTVGEYFQREKKYTLQYPYLPLVHIGPQNKEFFVPLEMCCITRGQALNRKLNPDQTSVMVKNAAKPPDERRQKIAMALRKANFNNDKCVQEFGITVSDRFAQVTGRVLEPPTLEYNKQQVKPAKGVWRSGRFLQPVEIRNWAIINCDYRTNDGSLQRFSADMAKNGQSLGINIVAAPRIIPFTQKLNKMSWLSEFKKTLGSLKCGNNQMEIVIVVIPDKGDIYPMVKQTAELSVGILTQCIKSKTMYRMNPATIGNILLKVNSKLNGVNHKIGGRPKLLQRPAMIMGADVTHPSPDQTNIPSVAAVSASHDANGFMYNMMWRLQAAKSEIIVDLQNIVAAQLKFFYQKTRCKPETIYFFRDGVSEGMFTQVLSAELTAIRKACRSLNENYKPGITFLVVQKRHHTRFFPRHDRDRDGKWGNVPAGTIVDTQVTHKTETDFYLVSHASIQGTARPTKYHLLWDDNDIDEDDLEELTYNLCHMFTRCTRSVSYPAPTYYAHLAAFRARVYLEGQVGDFSESNLAREMEKRIIDVNFHRENPMFFV